MDLSRLVSRAGRVVTGIDRVELAYLRHFLADDVPCYGLVRTAFGFVLLEPDGLKALGKRLDGSLPWGAPDALSNLPRGYDAMRRRAEADLRRLCAARTRPMFLTRMIRRHLPRGASYVNVGHTNFSERVIWAMKHGAAARVSVFVHDTIPLDSPQFQREGSVSKFRGFLKRALRHADVVLCNSAATKADILRYVPPDAPVPGILVAHLGIDLNCSQIEDNVDLPEVKSPYFVCVGTIEPRKNHGFLLDLWEHMNAELKGQDLPALVLCGTRGWRNEDVFRRLDRTPLKGRLIFEFSGLDDARMAAMIRNSCGLLFPSLAEGYGLPAMEAAALGVPVVCNELPVMREVLGDIPIYANVSDSYSWENAVLKLAVKSRQSEEAVEQEARRFDPPDWASHFGKVLPMV